MHAGIIADNLSEHFSLETEYTLSQSGMGHRLRYPSYAQRSGSAEFNPYYNRSHAFFKAVLHRRSRPLIGA